VLSELLSAVTLRLDTDGTFPRNPQRDPRGTFPSSGPGEWPPLPTGVRHISGVIRRWSFLAVVSLAVGAMLFVLGTASAANTTVVLGKKNLYPYGVGWGTPHPRRIFNGGDPSGNAWRLLWRHWGAASATASGLTSISRPNGGGYYSKPGAIEFRASRVGRCTPHGPRAYTRLHAREAVRPGGPLGQWFAWGAGKGICRVPR
jgi:hypothetical protein